ncbi:MAG: GTPase Era [Betaproteobacteria bacterium]
MSGTAAVGRTGYVAIVGRPNVGKSTLLNALVGEHVSITSRKPQTTRERVLGVLTDGAPPVRRQFVFVDTPGFQKRHRTLLTRRMNEAVAAALAEVDAVIFVVEAARWTQDDDRVLALLPQAAAGQPSRVILALNKTDRIKERDTLLPRMAEASARFPFAAIVPVSAENGQGYAPLLDEVAKLLPEGPLLFEPDQYTDRNVRFLAAERIREKAFRLLGDELPYGVAVTIDQWEEDEGQAAIAATLWVERDSHKAMAIGAGGAKLREIGRLARADIAALLAKPVRLDTHVRVRKRWNDDPAALRALGYE